MATKHSLSARAVAKPCDTDQKSLARTAQQVANNLAGDPSIRVFSIEVNKETGVMRAKIKKTDGTTATATQLAPGMRVTTTSTPTTRKGIRARITSIARQNPGMPQTAIAEIVGCSQGTVSNTLRGK